MSESEKKKNKCGLCKEIGHTKRTCPKKEQEETKYEEVKVEEPESREMYIILDSGIYGFTEYYPRVVEICETPQDVADVSNELIQKYFEMVGDKDTEYNIPEITVEKVQELIEQKKVVVQIISLTNKEHEEESRHSMASYRLRMQVFKKPIRNHSAKS